MYEVRDAVAPNFKYSTALDSLNTAAPLRVAFDASKLTVVAEDATLVTAAVALNKNIRSSNIFSLSLINVELILKQNKDVHQVTEISSYYILSNISNSLSKLSIAQFLNEILIKSIKEHCSNSH